MSKFTPATVVITRANRFAGEYPQEMPRFSEAVIADNPELQGLQTALTKWYFDFRTVLLRNISELESAVDALATKDETDESIAEVAGNITNQQTEIADMLARLDALESDILGLETTDAGLQSQINQILLAITILQGQAADASARLDSLETFAYSPSGVTAGTYGAQDTVGQFVVDAYGRITSATDIPILILSAAVVNSHFVTSVTGTGGRISSSGGLTPVIDLVASGVAANTYGSASVVPVITVDTYGRITTAVDTPIVIAQSAVTNLVTDLAGKAALVHASRHMSAGADPIRIDELKIGTDVTTLNATVTEHGLLRRLSGTATEFFSGSGTWAVPAGTIFNGGDISNVLRQTGDGSFPVSGAGLEIVYQLGVGVIQSYNRTGLVYTPFYLDGLTLSLRVSGVTKGLFNSSGLTLTPQLAIASGGTGQVTALAAFNALSPFTTRGDLLTRDATNNIRLAIGTVGKYLRTDGTDPGWSALLVADLSGQVSVANGGTGAATLTGILQGNGTSAITAITGTTDVLPKWAASAPYLVDSLLHSGTNLVEQYNSTNAQSWKLFGTRTDASNLEVLTIKHNASATGIAFTSEALGTGTVRDFTFMGGKVGIGGSPAEKFEVVGGKAKIAPTANKFVIFNDIATSILTDFSVGGAGFAFSRPSDGAQNTQGVYSYGTAAAAQRFAIASRGDVIFAAGGSSTYDQSPEVMRIVSTGKVGIGTTAPDRALEINSATGINLRLTYNDSNGTAATFADFLVSSAGLLTLEPSSNQIAIPAGASTSYVKLGGNLVDYSADVSVGGAEADIFTATTAASILGTDKDKLIASYSGNFVTVGTELTQLKVYFAGTAIWDSTGVAPSTGTTSWMVYVEIIRVSSSVVRFSVSLNTTGATGYVYCTVGELTGLTLSNTNILKITGTSSGVGSGVGDCIGKMGFVRWESAA